MIFPFQPHVDLGLLGKGSFGEVRRVRLWNGTEVACKYLRENTPENFAMFRREVEHLEKFIDETYIVNILGHDLNAPTPYFYMELCDGTLRDYIGRFDNEQIFDVLWCLTQGFKAIHGRGSSSFHRDFKPDNTLMRPLGALRQPLLSDFGLARTPNPFTLMTCRGGGTWPYMAPEIKKEHPFTQAADIYSLGITFYEMFSGKAERPAFSLNIPGSLNHMLARMTDSNPAKRPTIWDVEREVKAAIELRASPVANFLSKLTGGEVILGATAALVVIDIFFGGKKKA
jgi:serine/threonine protein kinase